MKAFNHAALTSRMHKQVIPGVRIMVMMKTHENLSCPLHQQFLHSLILPLPLFRPAQSPITRSTGDSRTGGSIVLFA